MNNPLAELKDIHTPDSIGFWPPAYGWWLLALLTIILSVWLIRIVIKHYKQGLAKRQAIQELNSINPSALGWQVALNSLLKRLVLSYQPTLRLHALHGEALTGLLTEALPTSKKSIFQQKMTTFQSSLYQTTTSSDGDFDTSKNLVLSWIKAAKLNDKKVKQRLSLWCEKHNGKLQGANHV
jgi:hypothetical protein